MKVYDKYGFQVLPRQFLIWQAPNCPVLHTLDLCLKFYLKDWFANRALARSMVNSVPSPGTWWAQ
jgi:hypothetical protein